MITDGINIKIITKIKDKKDQSLWLSQTQSVILCNQYMIDDGFKIKIIIKIKDKKANLFELSILDSKCHPLQSLHDR